MKKSETKGIFAQISARKASFALSFIAIFLLSLLFLGIMGAVPVKPAESDRREVETSRQDEAVTLTEEPVRVVATSINLDEKIFNPASTDVAILDTALLSGAVRYPGSAFLGERGNVLLFGHSSYLNSVFNSAYKTFNDIQKLRTGDVVSIYSRNTEYRYRVVGVRLAKATNTDEVIDLSANRGKRLTLVTCNSFGAKSDRFVVEAEFVGKYLL